ncbi:MAG TPA: S28 family serine protease [Myxococcota bacterium]|nr:S28 family serine protease [Myxococcota bacterium]
MKRLMLAAMFAACACAEEPQGPALADELAVVPGLHVFAADAWTDGRTRVIADFEQAVDHTNPSGQAFMQRLVIFHRDAAAPMVLSTQGYGVGEGLGTTEPTAILQANEVQVEHRFFGASLPEPADWSQVTIAQAAGDHHAVVEALSVYYSGPWVSTGASKGGVAALAHRRFYPADVAGTVAYVAPFTTGLADVRYVSYVNELGADSCGAALRDFQEEILTEPRRGELVASLDEAMDLRGYETSTLGTDAILELTTVETAFTFWQYSSADNCQLIPDVATDSDDEVLSFIDATNRFALWSDQGIAEDQGYWLAVAAEQGYPAVPKAHLGGLLRHDDEPTPLRMVTALASPPAYDPGPMQDLADWVATEAANVVLIYGSRDPWTAGAFTISGANDTSSHLVTGGNHLARVRSLPQNEQDAIVTRLEAWLAR